VPRSPGRFPWSPPGERANNNGCRGPWRESRQPRKPCRWPWAFKTAAAPGPRPAPPRLALGSFFVALAGGMAAGVVPTS
jgi:hypothetical protein